MLDDALALLRANFPELMLPPALRPRLAAALSVRRLAAGRCLFLQGHIPRAFYAVLAGEVETRFTGLDGRTSVLDLIGPPRFFGLAAFAAQQPAEYEALARRASRVLVLGPEAYALLMDEVPGFARALMAEFARRFDLTMQLLHAARHQSAPERFALALGQLARQRGQLADDGATVVAATQAELAALANLSRQTVNEFLQAAVAQGQMRLGRGRIWLLKP